MISLVVVLLPAAIGVVAVWLSYHSTTSSPVEFAFSWTLVALLPQTVADPVVLAPAELAVTVVALLSLAVLTSLLSEV